MTSGGQPLLATDRVPAGGAAPVVAQGREWVVWRTGTGRWCALPRRCPHLDWDLAEARVVGDELECPGHGWHFTCAGQAGKRTERGRVDPKGTVPVLALRETGGLLYEDDA